MAKTAEQEPLGPLMNVDQVAEYIDMSPRWVRREGPAHYGLPLKKIGNSLKGVRAEIDRWISQQPPVD